MKNIKYKLFFIAALLTLSAFSQQAELSQIRNARTSAKDMDLISRKFTLISCLNENVEEATDTLKEIIINQVSSLDFRRVKKEEIEKLDYITNCYHFLKVCKTNDIQLGQDRLKLLIYLLSSHKKTHTLTGLISELDDTQKVFSIIETLLSSEPTKEDQEKFFNLIIALAVVWDQEQPRFHTQMGYSNELFFEDQIIERYKYYKALYSSRATKIDYKDLSAEDLIYVVGAAVPLTELEWAQANIKNKLKDWGKLYFSIVYSWSRLNEGVYSWPNGSYTLENIKKHGGICVDQAYFCTLTARALGIPALFFDGEGQTGKHAWSAYKTDDFEWALDIGRYSQEKYVVGFTINPQTNERMTDHQLGMLYNKIFAKANYKKADRYLKFAKILGTNELSMKLTISAIKLAPLDENAWDYYIELIKAQDNNANLLKALESKIKAFKKFPDIYTKTLILKANLLKEMGNESEAAKLLKSAQKDNTYRDDLTRDIATMRVDELVQQRKFTDARKLMEKLIKDQKNERAKTLTFIERYLEITAQSGQTKEAERFVPKYLKSIYKSLATASKNQALKLMVEAYRNNDNQKMVDKTIKKYLD
ncbi:MAG: hypothetical protein NE330_01860 [Lentisphaeraceae bacterium]|nr:hypothetical protein [Lentisphaeraceae bacterium]